MVSDEVLKIVVANVSDESPFESCSSVNFSHAFLKVPLLESFLS